MLEFQRQILTELKDEDGLLILGKGLGLTAILQQFLLAHADTRNLVLLLNTPPDEEARLRDALARQGVTRDQFRILKNDIGSQERVQLYHRGGLFSITSRILVVDMLAGRLPTELVTGVVVNHAHQVATQAAAASSSEAFILRLLRERNQRAFIKAFSDSPEAFAQGFSPLERALKALKLRRAFLWPRFHVAVGADLDGPQTTGAVVELRQPLAPSMQEIQLAVMDCMRACVAELRRFHKLVDLDEINLENSLVKSFDGVLRRQLDPLWHRISARTKRLVADISQLRRLIGFLASYDCVTFYEYLETLLAANNAAGRSGGIQSPWIMTDAGDLLFRFARDRVYRREFNLPPALQQSLADIGLPPNIQPVLEEQPKWALLRDTLDEVYAFRQARSESADDNGSDSPPGSILVMVSTQRTGQQLQQYLGTLHNRVEIQPDSEDHPTRPAFLTDLLRHYFRWKYRVNSITSVAIPPSAAAPSKPPSPTRAAQPGNKRRRVRGGAAGGQSYRAGGSARSSAAPVLPDTETALENFFTSRPSEATEPGSAATSRDQERATIPPESLADLDEADFMECFGVLDPQEMVLFRTYQGEADMAMLNDLKPHYIIMYDPSPMFVRQIELFKVTHPQIPLRVYFMVYENSVEEQLYLTNVRREKDAFEKLIHERSVMVIPLDAYASQDPLDYQHELTLLKNLNTRIAGGGRLTFGTARPQIVVDVREFRSALPSVLHLEGFTLKPCTLIVGDYVLSPTVCVERKSIPDLISSFSSGRLYSQAESMAQYYTTPVLLIEFEEGGSFSLQALGDLKSDIVLSDISSKLVMLTLAFPTLQLLWSSSPRATAEMFQDLKGNQEEPDMNLAMRLGSHSETEINAVHNMTPQDMLRSMPGVTSANHHLIINEVKNIAELCDLSLARLKTLIGNLPGQRLHDFLHRKQHR
ncbi:DNA repair protein RAD16 [Dimargaris cristalligena]|uniref:ERCC4 domain-containing protein n=1 Tax=Dimargaris cristalligena TaxID=215637 RepID=A0A4P9ZZ46_9FUNG|nr:DNA repair protein RAD16 [Dimargaris cristalligena]RKP38070.1 hypothetical protein BJ085DRAFT_16446 [Dimargaris cristalligena]|eukprot:RKP38070.1 hypothetical protein BJ085DRAFT_16446 [Dimargaris cristalligena]